MKHPTVSFKISTETQKKIQNLPRGFNLSEKLRLSLVDILYNFEHPHTEQKAKALAQSAAPAQDQDQIVVDQEASNF